MASLGPTDDSRRANDIREVVKNMKVTTLDDTVVKDSLVFREEESFWTQVVEMKLNPKSDTINNIKGLKDKLKELKYTGILILVMVNALWLAMMILLATVRFAA